jgi:tRNA 5-methylaminomethyl-2-thiouridine biosynthesis bifunctional protein
MTPSTPAASDEIAAWSQSGPPRSRAHGDVYFSADDGLGEARTVFLEGCGLPQAWRGRRSFCVGELGFGAGLNIAALLQLWRRSRDPDARLHVFTVEEDLLTAAEAARALSTWLELEEVAAALTDQWPGRVRGFRRIDLPQFGATVDVAQMEAAEALQAWSGAADAWFLDGFSPARDPRIWREAVLALVAARSAPGARAATYTVAGAVRRGLVQAGFEVERRPGHGPKRERLEARLASRPQAEPQAPSVAIIGAGIAGASIARAFAALGAQPLVFDARRPGAGASGVPAALTAPRLDAGLAAPAQLFAQAAARAHALYALAPGAILSRGVVQLAAGDRDVERFSRIAASQLFEPGVLAPLSPEESSRRLGEPAAAAVEIADALAVDPAAILRNWLDEVRFADVRAVERRDGAWALLDAAGAAVAVADVVCLAAGAAGANLARGLPLTPVRGQASLAVGVTAPAASFGAYIAPAPRGALFGATHERGETDETPREGDHARNVESVARVLPRLGARLGQAPLEAWVGVRAASPDYLPLAGSLQPGLFVLCGLGSRGFCLAPLLAEHIAAQALGAPSPLPAALARLVDPHRFARRAARRGEPRNR